MSEYYNHNDPHLLRKVRDERKKDLKLNRIIAARIEEYDQQQ